VADIYRHYRKTQHALRLQGAHMARTDPAQFANERACVRTLWQIVIAPCDNLSEVHAQPCP